MGWKNFFKQLFRNAVLAIVLVHHPALVRPLESWFDQTWQPGDIELID